MNEDPLNRYQSMMNDTHAPAHLPEQVFEQARAHRVASAWQMQPRAKPGRRPSRTCFSVKRTCVSSLPSPPARQPWPWEVVLGLSSPRPIVQQQWRCRHNAIAILR